MGLFFPDYGTPLGKPRGQTLSFAGVAAGHAALLGLVALAVPAERFADLARPFTARLIESAPEVPPPPPPPRQPQKQALPAPLPVLVANSPAPSPQPATFTVAPQPPAPVAAPAPVGAPVEAPVTAARFDADYLHNPKPVYPQASRKLSEEGKVVLRVRVSAEGLAENVEVKHTSGFPRLDQAALDAVTRWRFVPARRGDEAVAAWVLVPITFNLQG